MCMALGRGQPNRALIKGTVLVPSRRDLRGAVIPGKVERGYPQGLSRSEPKVTDEPGKPEPFDYSAYPTFPEASQFRHRSDRLGIYSGSFAKNRRLAGSAFSNSARSGPLWIYPAGRAFSGSWQSPGAFCRRSEIQAKREPPKQASEAQAFPDSAPAQRGNRGAGRLRNRQADTPAVSAGACRDGQVAVRFL